MFDWAIRPHTCVESGAAVSGSDASQGIVRTGDSTTLLSHTSELQLETKPIFKIDTCIYDEIKKELKFTVFRQILMRAFAISFFEKHYIFFQTAELIQTPD